MVITKSKYVDYILCERLFDLNENHPEKGQTSEFMQLLALQGVEVGKVGRSYFGDYVLVDRNDKVKQTQDYLKQGQKVIAEASFIYKDLFCAVDLLKVDEDGVEIYEIKSASIMEENYTDDVSFQTYVLTKLGYNVKNSYVLHINKDYVLGDKLDLKQLFKKEKVNIKKDVEKNIENIRNGISKTTSFKATENCKDCPYFKYCFASLPENSVFNLSGLKKTFEYYNKDIITFEDYLTKVNNQKGTNHNKILEQIDYELNDKPLKVDKVELNKFMGTLEYPLYYLDFETITHPIPKFKGYKTNHRLLIQYSLHIKESKDSELIHKEYLLKEDYDNREEVANRLINDLGKKGSIIVYNKSFESKVIEELSDLVPKYKPQLLSLLERIIDLEVPFKKRAVYNKKMVGRSSIKKVLPAMCPDYENSYKDLSLVHNGVDAMTLYNKMLNNVGEEKERIANGLFEYCGLDTMAMVAILEQLYTLI